MSYEIYLKDKDGNVLEMDESFEEGGTFPVGGTKECHLNVTWNYSCMFDFRNLHGMTGEESNYILDGFCNIWKHCEPWQDYWAPTPGNVKKACQRLLSFAMAHPDGIWEVS